MNIKYNSKLVKKGDVFIALKTNNDGHKYIEDAIKNGASKIIAEYGSYSVPTLIVPDTKEYLIKYLSENYYKGISKLKLIGITGTNGKTTTALIIHNLLNKMGIKCAYIGTNGFYIDKFIKDLPNTTPEIIDIYDLLYEALDNGCEYVVLETSSHGLDQNRLYGLKFDMAVFTNLTHEHLGYHKTMENYMNAKRKLFSMLRNERLALINSDSSYASNFMEEFNTNITYGFGESDYRIIDYDISLSGSNFTLLYENKEYKFNSPLIGKHNIYNTLVAIIVLSKIGLSFDSINSNLSKIELPSGRMEKINYRDNLVIVDYAHTPDGIENVINSSKELNPNRIITVIGCGGGGKADITKRPIMGNLVLDLSSYVIFTNDNPREEDPVNIINDLVSETNKTNYEVIYDRYEAIKEGINLLNSKDMLLILGKGHEDYQIIGDMVEHFNDKEVVLKVLGDKDDKGLQGS